MKLEQCHTTELDKYISTNHYLKSVPAGAKLRLYVKDDNNNIIGAMMWGRPTASTYDKDKLLELTRFYMIDETEHCAESKALSMARKLIRKELPQVMGLLSYSSTGEQHKGTIYEADGWVNIGVTVKAVWNKKDRANIDTSQKLRWFRSP
jgi:hypothetical protein